MNGVECLPELYPEEPETEATDFPSTPVVEGCPGNINILCSSGCRCKGKVNYRSFKKP